MKVLIDTNIIRDVFIKREPHLEDSSRFMKLCGRKVAGCVAASQTTDLFYILRREGKDVQEAKALLRKLAENVSVLNINATDVENALVSEMPDYEDALLACCGARQRVECIVTRNGKDFRLSPIPALSPKAFLEQYFSDK